MIGAKYMNEIFVVLDEGHLRDPRHREVFVRIYDMYRHGMATDLGDIEHAFHASGDLEHIGGAPALYRMTVLGSQCDRRSALALALELAHDDTPDREERIQPVEASPFTHLPVSIPEGIIVFYVGDNHVPQCIGANTTGRCKAHLYPGQWEDWVIEGLGTINAADGMGSDPELFRQQRCPKHLGDGRPGVAPVDWEWFHPERFPALVSPHALIWAASGLVTLPKRPIERPAPTAVPQDTAGEVAVARQASRRPDVRTALYWHYDAAGRLLYIGITEGLVARAKAHATGSSWVEFAKTSRCEWFPNRSEAEVAEVAAIKAEQPLFNHTHNDTPEARAHLVAYLIEHGRTDLLAPAVSRG